MSRVMIPSGVIQRVDAKHPLTYYQHIEEQESYETFYIIMAKFFSFK